MKTKLQHLNDCGVEVSLFEIKLLMADAIGIDVKNLMFYDKAMSQEQIDKFEKYIEVI